MKLEATYLFGAVDNTSFAPARTWRLTPGLITARLTIATGGQERGDKDHRSHAPYLVAISQPLTSTTNSKLSGRNTFQPRRMSWS